MTANSAINARPPTTPWYRNWRFWLGGGVSVSLVVWGVWSLDWRQVWRALQDAHVGWIALAVITVPLTIGARVLRWRGLLWPQSFALTTLLTALLAGQVVNYAIMSQLGILVRAAALGPGNRARALGTVTLEKLWDVAMLLGLIMVLSFGVTLPGWLTLPARLLAIAAAVATLLLLVTLRFRNRFSFKWPSFVPLLLDGLEGLTRPRALILGLLGSLAVWGLGAATNYCVLRAFGLTSSTASVLLLLAALQAGIAVPSLPGSVGVFEGICIAVLALFGIGQEEALAAGLVLHVVVFVPPMLLGGALMWKSGYRDLSNWQGGQT